MTLALAAIIGGLIVLVWSADRFVEGAASTAKHFGMTPLLIGIVVIGFGTSAPEMIVSASSALSGSPGIALGNAYGSNITNIALILGLTAIIKPLMVNSDVLKKELPILMAVTLLSAYLVYDANVTQLDAIILLAVFAAYMTWTVVTAMRSKNDALAIDVDAELAESSEMSLGKSILWLIIGLVLLVVSSQFLVWGAVEVAKFFGVSDLVIGLTIVAVGTSLPELASSIAAARKGEVDLALGNIIGSNLFNTLAVVGIAGAIKPMQVTAEVFSRDIVIMSVLTFLIFVFGLNIYRRPEGGRINRLEGFILFAAYVGYNFYLFKTAI
ncbi:Na+/Ca+ antiporter, CaCA [Mannheimia varigena USDA-ARS-USMARC-1388]|uniref:calcium/sodium antiporter n=1 Tax=Mannheimia varigena TaxID=85404 RepID=UPI0003E33208|nr:calcium/sodium antiporter [Mannheimia varigena]AHG79780.1 Na+/Ca+ antiporter, CaCA [Mannheimia varigena USDA-ARS-USMARC-1388]MDY2946903.1 calcium/sodium antiporter [Mannheimia varigena]QLB16259.1 calcium/sodium antiporter [Mannheimia varigena]QLD33107.1 calcium/sodium antiporter [Mannheimia varigena]TLU76119.1 calcium/sodium antiporter [Mannheimia varigena]